MATVELRGIGKTYGSGRPGAGRAVRAVADVDLSVRDGEFVVLVGPSGCGKSTLLRMIAGLEPITDGTLSIDGAVVNDVAPKDRDIAFVFQNYALYPHLTVRRNLAFGLERRARTGRLRALLSGQARAVRRSEGKSIDARVAKAAATLGIEGILDRMPGELSGGQRQRVAVGRAIVRDPKVFLFDEPLSNLDARLRIEMRGELRRLHRTLRATMVYVTHDQEEAMSLGDRLVVMRDGRVQQIGPPGEVYARPANRFVAGFVGTPPMNFIDGRLHRSDRGERFASDSLSIDLPAAKGAAATPGPIIAGVRPDRIALDRMAAERPWRGEARVERIESLGDRTEVHLVAGATRLLARVEDATTTAEGGTVAMGLDPADLHLFSADAEGLRLG